MSLRGRNAAVAILKLKAWNPVAKHGSTRREEIPITEAAKRAIPPSPLSPPHFQIPVRSVSSCLVPGCRLVPSKIAASGARALLAMTKSAGFAGKRNNFRSEKFRIRPGGAPPRCFSGSAISHGHQPAFHIHSIFHLLKEQISLRSHARPKAEFHCAARTVPCRVGRKERSPQIDFAATVWSFY